MIIIEKASETLTDQSYECFVASGVKAVIEENFGQDITFIVMSGHTRPIIETGDIDLELYPFLRKPLAINNLIEMVDSMLDIRNNNFDYKDTHC
ncbi:MAG TPA: hypothetical protein DIS98_02325 [Colwellia sp.]|nr:hypothetical protein [Colwellia sp.]